MGLSKCDKCGGDYFKRVFISSVEDKHRGHYEDLCVGCYDILKASGVAFEDHVVVPEHKELCCSREMVLMHRIGRNRLDHFYVELSFYECGVCGLWVVTEEVKDWEKKPLDRRISLKRRVVDFRDTSKQLRFDVLGHGGVVDVVNRVHMVVENTDKKCLGMEFEDFAKNVCEYLAKSFDNFFAVLLRHTDKEG